MCKGIVFCFLFLRERANFYKRVSCFCHEDLLVKFAANRPCMPFASYRTLRPGAERGARPEMHGNFSVGRPKEEKAVASSKASGFRTFFPSISGASVQRSLGSILPEFRLGGVMFQGDTQGTKSFHMGVSESDVERPGVPLNPLVSHRKRSLSNDNHLLRAGILSR